MFSSALVFGQVYTPPAGVPAAPTGVPQDIASGVAPPATAAATPFGQELPLLDPSAETISIAGITIPLGDNRLLKARFEKYLNQPAEDDEDAIAYRDAIATILHTVSPLRAGGPDIYKAFTLLPSAAAYPGDARICSTLAEAIYMAMLAKKDVNSLAKLNASIGKEREALIKEQDWRNQHDRGVDLRATRRSGRQGGGRGDNNNGQQAGNQSEGSTASVVTGGGTLRQQETLRRLAEIEVLTKSNIARTEAQTLRTKTQYQVNMVQWFAQRRYEHVVMAARFYNQIWRDGDTSLQIDEKSDVSRLFSESVGISPTVSSLDSFANEAIREVEKYVEAFDMLLERGELHSASQRLMEAYAIGEYLTPVATLPIEKKRKVAKYVNSLHELYNTIQARDYTRAKVLVAELRSMATDFPGSKADSIIAAQTLASDLSIEEAKGYLIARDNTNATAKIAIAAEMWPTNPRLEEFRNLVANSSVIVLARNDFDRLLSESNFREIARRQYEFAPVVQGDATREEAFEQIITNLRDIEVALSKADEFERVGQHYAAYEQLDAIREKFPDDPKLGREIELLAPKVADFTLALDKARQLEHDRVTSQTGSSLAWFLKARQIYPRSQKAEEGINRLLDEILGDGNTAAGIQP